MSNALNPLNLFRSCERRDCESDIDMSSFVDSDKGGLFLQQKNRIWVEGTIMAALGIVLSFIPLNIGSSFSISLGQIPLIVFALRRGVKAGMAAGLVWGLLHFVTGMAYFLTPVQVVLEYPIADACLGLAGIYALKLQNGLTRDNRRQATIAAIQGVFLGTFVRYIFHFIAGWIFWGAYALWGMKPWLFSLVMNGISGLATALASLIAVLILLKISHIFQPK